jgi:CheY-like chemotaxis protein
MQPHVLVVDDSQAVQHILELSLTRLGFAVTVASDAASGVAVMRSALHPLIVVFDCASPPDDSANLLPGALADPWTGDRHTFVLIHVVEPPRADPALQQMTQWLSRPPLTLRKPFRLSELLNVITQAANDLNSRP